MDKLNNLTNYCKTWEEYFSRSHEAMNEILIRISSVDITNAQLMAKVYSKNNLSLMADGAMKEYRSLMAELTKDQKDNHLQRI